MPISTNGTVVARFAGALYNQQLSNATYSEVVSWSNTNNLAGLINEVYARDFSLMSDSAVATLFVANLGLSAIAGTQAYVAAQLTAAGANKGGMLASLLNTFSQMTADPVYGAAATAFNAQVVISQTLSQTAGNNGGTFTTINTAAGNSFTLTTGFDNLVGTAFNDIFNAPTVNGVNRLQDGDRIDGGAGVDTVYVDYQIAAGAGNNTITPNFRNIESVVVRAQNATSDANGIGATDGNNMPSDRTIHIDAQRSLATDAANKVTADLGVVNWESSNSRSDVVIEDVRIGNTQKTKDVTITFRESDPGNVDYGVYFDIHSLRNAGTGTASLNIFLMDTAAAAATPATPLLNQNFNTYTFFSNNVKVVLGGTGTAAGTAIDNATTYAQLKDAFILALKTASVGGVTTDLSASVTVTSSGPVNMTTESAKATESATVSANFLGLTGEIITLTSTGAASITSKQTVTNEAGGWTAAGPAPSTGAIVQTLNTGSTSTTELVTSKVVLDDVGRGSTGGDLVIGGMSIGDTSQSRGVERFEITVEDSSKLQTINSTNNALREVTIVNGKTSNVSSAYNTVVTDAGDLTVNGNINSNTDNNLPGVNNNSTWSGVVGTQAAASHSGENAAGFTDVRLIDASTMTGKLNFTAAITTDTLGKYVNLVDTQNVPTADVAASGNVNFNARGANFLYTGGTNNDTMVVTIDSAVAASNTITGQSDFTIVIDGGAGNDIIKTNFGGTQTAAWLNDQFRNANVTVNGGAGNDTITTTGAGSVKINAGAGNDTVYTDNSGAKATWVVNATNTLADLSANAGVSSAATAVTGTSNALAGTNFLFGGKLTVTVSGAAVGGGVVAGAADSIASPFSNGYEVVVDIPTDANYKTSQFFLNQAVKAAINDNAVLSKLFVAKDGPNSTLTISSLIDGTFANTDLSMTVSNTAMTATDTAALTAFQTLIGNTTTAVLVDAQTAATATVAAANGIIGFSAAGAGAGSVLGVTTAGVAEVATVTIVANANAGETQTINGMTFTAAAGATAADLELAMETGANSGLITVSGAYNPGWTVGAAAAGTVTFTSTANGGINVTNLAIGGSDATPSTLGIVDGTGVSATGSASTASSSNTINMGAGNDVLVLGTGTTSKDKIVFTGTGINTTIVNFDSVNASTSADKLDFTSYLGDKATITGTTATIATTTAATAANTAQVITPNEVLVLNAAGFTTVAGTTFAGLTDAAMLAALNGTAYGTIGGAAIFTHATAQTALQLNGGVGHAVVLVENNLNLGQYDAFNVTWDATGAVATAGTFTAATLIGVIDFGNSVALTMAAPANLS